MINLDNAKNFIRETEKNNTDYKIGIVRMDIPSMAVKKKGAVVIFTVHDPNKASERDKRYWSRGHSRDSVTLTVETPYSPEVIQEHKDKNNYVFSQGAIVSVPARYVRDVNVRDYALDGLRKILML